MKKMALVIGFLFFALGAHAQTPACGLNKQGGGDIFPWSKAEPFVWETIQGLWKVSDQPDNIIRMRVVRKDSASSKLEVEVLSRSQCGRVMRGPGIINDSEPNVVRISLVDSTGTTRLMKLAFFDSRDLQMDANLCGQTVLAASVIEIGHESDDKIIKDATKTAEPKSNMMLKKITPSTDFYCRKRRN